MNSCPVLAFHREKLSWQYNAQNAACQSHISCLTGLWFLPQLAQGLNTNQSQWKQGVDEWLVVSHCQHPHTKHKHTLVYRARN
jgi:predicted exporter